MPNTQTSVPLYAQGEVLTAANLNLTNSGIPVFATTVTRDAAFGGANEKVLAEGQFAYIEATNTTQYYDGAAWQTVGASGLTFITGTTFTTVTSVSLPTNTFTSTYENYKMFFFLTALTADSNFTVRLRASGTDDSSGNYGATFGGATTDSTFLYNVNNGGTSFPFGDSDGVNGRQYNIGLDVISPQSANRTKLHATFGGINAAAAAFYSCQGQGFFFNTTSFDSLTVISSTASSMTGFYKVYGYSNS